MSQEDKPEPCGALAENGFCTMPKGHNMGRLDIPSNHKSEPIAAQEPFGYWHQGETDEESDFFPVSYCHGAGSDCPDCIPLYDHAAPCADPIAWRNIASPNGIRRFMTQKQYDANPNLQKYYEPFTCARCADIKQYWQERKTWWKNKSIELQAKITEQVEELRIIRANEAQLEKDFDRRNEVVDAQAERIKALEALSMQSNQDHLNARKDYQTKLAKADAVILKCKEAMTWDIGGEPLPTLEIAALAAIEAYQKGEEA